MTFMLGYAWRRQNNSGKSANGHLSPAPLVSQVSSESNDENCHPEPPTPEGLRPRKCLDTIREELDVPAHVFQQAHPQNLPARSRTSPQISNSSFYSRGSSSAMVAESPDLGQARTAVGAVVAMTQGVVSNNKPSMIPEEARFGVLPPRTWNKLPEEDDDVEEFSYERLHDSMDVAPWTPGRLRSGEQPTSPESTIYSSILPSPSSPSWKRWQQQQDDQRDINISFSSQVALVKHNKREEALPYDFDPISGIEEEGRQDTHDGSDFIVASDTANMEIVSILSQSSAAHNHSIHSLDSVRVSYTSKSQPKYRYKQEREEYARENALLQRKTKNQRRSKEQLLMGVVQRLQHNLDLVSEVDALHEEDVHWFVNTQMDKEGLLTGFSPANRIGLLKYVQSVLQEMSVARPEEFFLSPSQIESMADTHDDLHDALVFLQGMLQIAVPLSGQTLGQRWTCQPEVRSAIVITSIPESPEVVRGGDTSFFSLPSESTTPHTSNMSMATTITTKPSPYRDNQRSTYSQEAGQIRRTIEISCTLLQKISSACHRLGEDSIRATEEIKRYYMQLMVLKHQDLRSVVDAFVVEETIDLPIARQVSVDEEHAQMQIVPARPVLVEQPTQRVVHVKTGPALFSPCTVDMQSVRIETDDEIDEEYEEDDLRRQVGSNDYDDVSEERDAPEEDLRYPRTEAPAHMENISYYTWGASELANTPYRKY